MVATTCNVHGMQARTNHGSSPAFASKTMAATLNAFAQPGCGRQPGRLAISIPEGPEGLEDGRDMYYPPEAVQVRNTFIHVASPAAPEGAYRAALTCPASHVGLIQRTMKEWQDDVKPAEGKPVIRLEDALCGGEGGWMVDPIIEIQTPWQCHTQGQQMEPPTAAPLAPAPGTSELPSVGSSGHHTGDCKPCSFLYSAQGCRNGPTCMFCHLCDRSEKKRRQKLMKATLNKSHQAA